MSFLVKSSVAFVLVFLLFVGGLFVSYRCGVSTGRSEASRYFYSADVMGALRADPAFKRYVDSLYTATYNVVLDSVIRTDRVLAVVGQWLDAHPGCEMMDQRSLPIDSRMAEKVFLGRRK